MPAPDHRDLHARIVGMSARLAALALLAVGLLAGCSTSAGGAFSDVSPSPVGGAHPSPAALDTGALRALRESAASAVAAHVQNGALAESWGDGAAVSPAGPFPASGAVLQELGAVASSGSQRDAL